ncbi:MAG: hypothetical protein WA919_08835 [Coleofasciculaceae cyanobacterium]
MKSKLAIIFASATLTVTSAALPAAAWNSWEHPFLRVNFGRISQSTADAYCRNQYFRKGLASNSQVLGRAPLPHIWAHLSGGWCVYNS